MDNNKNNNEGEIRFTKIRRNTIKYGIIIFLTTVLLSYIFGTLSAQYIATKKIEEFKTLFTDNSSSQTESTVERKIPTRIYNAAAVNIKPSLVGISNSVEGFQGDSSQKNIKMGLIYRKDGYIVTNYHLVLGWENTKIFVKQLSSETGPAEGEIYAYDKDYDIAIIKINKLNLPAPNFGNSDTVAIGDLAISITNSNIGESPTVSGGLINSISKIQGVTTRKKVNVFQTDSCLSAKNDGGPLCDEEGTVIGINNFQLKIVDSPESIRITSYAITINEVKKVADQLIEFKKVKQPQLGINGLTANPDENDAGISGVYVQEVIAESGIQEGSIKSGDIITEIDNVKINSWEEYADIINSKNIDDEVVCKIYREGQHIDVSAKITEKKSES